MAQIGDVMKPPRTIGPRATVTEAADRMREMGTDWLFVAAGTHLMGLVTERDLLHKAMTPRFFTGSTYVVQVMTSRLVVGIPEMEVDEALRIMARHNLRILPVVADEKLVGAVAIQDLLPGRPRERLERPAEIPPKVFMPRSAFISDVA
jgi:CBS domain-containing protein